MFWLIFASIIWGFSFGLIKGKTGHVDPFLLSLIRITFAFLLGFLITRPSKIVIADKVRMGIVGAFQLGFMYAPYLISFKYLKGYEVALFTMTTPIFVVLFDFLQKRQVSSKLIYSVTLAMVGGSLFAWKSIDSAPREVLIGFSLVQFSNILFAYGQHLLVRWNLQNPKIIMQAAAFYFVGALLASLLCFGVSISMNGMPNLIFSAQDYLVFMWLGIVSTGLGILIWNYGVLKVKIGELAVASDLKLPIAVIISIVVFHESASIVRIIIGGGALFFATFLAKRARN